MNTIEAPDEYDGVGSALFLAGGIRDAENWQARMLESLHGISATVLNPRRIRFSDGNPAEKRQQIQWEHRHLLRADLIAFWFPPQTLCPIALFELGVCCASETPILVGVDPCYARRFDIEVQLGLRMPEVKVVDSLDVLANQVLAFPAFQSPVP